MVAGKGHENSQEINGRHLNFDDAKIIKSMINCTSDKHLGYWYEEHQVAREGIVSDGKFSKEGLSWLDRLHSLERMLLSEGLTRNYDPNREKTWQEEH